jgi:hypothetical protein
MAYDVNSLTLYSSDAINQELTEVMDLAAIPPALNSSNEYRASKWTVNRARNTGAGAAFLYWLSPDGVDVAGIYYTGSVEWPHLTDVIAVGETYPPADVPTVM